MWLSNPEHVTGGVLQYQSSHLLPEALKSTFYAHTPSEQFRGGFLYLMLCSEPAELLCLI